MGKNKIRKTKLSNRNEAIKKLGARGRSHTPNKALEALRNPGSESEHGYERGSMPTDLMMPSQRREQALKLKRQAEREEQYQRKKKKKIAASLKESAIRVTSVSAAAEPILQLSSKKKTPRNKKKSVKKAKPEPASEIDVEPTKPAAKKKKKSIKKATKPAVITVADTNNPKPVIKLTTKANTSQSNLIGAGPASKPPLFDEKMCENLPSSEIARRVFQWLIHPIPIEKFYEEYSEQQPLYIARNPKSIAKMKGVEGEGGSSYYEGIWTRSDVDRLLNEKTIIYGKDIDITRFSNDERQTFNPPGQARAKDIASFIDQGCSLRFLCPQRFHDPMWKLLAYLDEYWGVGAGANTYLTPAGTQGFAPHYDDVDIFVIQTEGAKRWRLYPPRSDSEVLDEQSSRNFKQHEISEPFMDVTLRQGDFLYAPRGTIHQCVADEEENSHHVTISTALLSSWGQLMRIALKRGVEVAMEDNIEFRKTLPRGYQNFIGLIHQDKEDDSRRDQFHSKFHDLLHWMMASESIPIDSAADTMAVDFMEGRVPAFLSAKHKSLCFSKKTKNLKIKGSTRVRMVWNGVARLTIENTMDGQTAILHHIMENSRFFKEKPMARMEFPLTHATAIEALIDAYPNSIAVSDLPFEWDETDKDGRPVAVPKNEEHLQAACDLVTQLFRAKVVMLDPEGK